MNSAPTTLTINNVAPQITEVTADFSGVNAGGVATLTGTFTDPGTSDEHEVTIGWGDPTNPADSTFGLGATLGLNVGDEFNSSTDSAVLQITGINTSAGEISFRVDHQYGGLGVRQVLLQVEDDVATDDRAALIDFGPVDYRQMVVHPFDGQTRCRLETTHGGLLTIEAVDSEEDVILEDVEGDEIARGRRIDHEVEPNDTYYLRLTGNGASQVRLTNLVQHQNTTVTVHGTDGANRFSYASLGSRRITVEETVYHFEDSEVTLVEFFGAEGKDKIVVKGSDENEDAELWPAGNSAGNNLEFGDGIVTVTAAGIEEIRLVGGGGADMATMTDTTGADNLIGRGEIVTLFDATYFWDEDLREFVSLDDHSYQFSTKYFAIVTVNSTVGPDQAYFMGSDGNEWFEASANLATFISGGFEASAVSFWKTHAYGKRGYDEGQFWGEPTMDRFHATWAYGRLYGVNPVTGNEYVHRAVRLEKVTAEGCDVALLDPSPNPDRLEGELGDPVTGEPAETRWRLDHNEASDTARFEYVALDFPVVKAWGSGSSSGDFAYLSARPGDNYQPNPPGGGTLWNEEELIVVHDFDDVIPPVFPAALAHPGPSSLLAPKHEWRLPDQDLTALAYAQTKESADAKTADHDDEDQIVDKVLETCLLWADR
jgi:hypothetical protein